MDYLFVIKVIHTILTSEIPQTATLYRATMSKSTESLADIVAQIEANLDIVSIEIRPLDIDGDGVPEVLWKLASNANTLFSGTTE